MKTILHCLALTACCALSAAPKVDRYGQSAAENWPGKITRDAQMRAELERESAELADVKPDMERFDRFGGVKTGKPLAATGFFRVQKIDGRWWLVTPEGNPFYLKGVDAVPYTERGYFTAARDSGGAIRKAFTQAAPDPAKYLEAWSKDKKLVNFLAANLYKKYGPDFRERWMELTEKRLRSWGFNSAAKWNNPFHFDRLPFLHDEQLRVKRFDRFIDPYDPGFEAAAETQVKAMCAKLRGNPYLIGYQLENENGWGRNAPAILLRDASGKLAAKRALLQYLAERNGGDPGKFFDRSGAPIETLMTETLATAAVPPELLDGFIVQASRRYHEILRGLVKKYDPDHLFLGASHCSSQSVEWIDGARESVDLIALHEYDLDSRWIHGTLAGKLREWDKPFAVLEFSFTNHRRGFACGSSTVVKTEADRGTAFRIYTEKMAADPLCVGTGYFILYDQPVTSRGHDAEAYNFGLIDVTDRPYREMLAGVKAANARLFDVHAGKQEPIPMQPLRAVKRSLREFLPESVGAVTFDSSNPQFHHNRLDRVRFGSNARFGVPLAVGTVDAGKPDGFEKLEFYVFLWKTEKNRNLSDWFQLEESADNVTFSPAPAVFRLHRDGPFREYVMTPQALKPGTRFVRLSFVLNDPAAPWATSLAEVKVERR
ncbi:hypothetical protein [uncultured Victivallis sp.]|uniref:hypothetical protein n=1 Tax=uncultured Victivallis sp. TaxID=354118 RepID=UPI00258BD3C1|nr:hypothetical protein [uncultured Victivallis sp.]